MVFPAPLAPSRPVTPLGMAKVAPSSAVVDPNRRVSPAPSATVRAGAETPSPIGNRA